MAYQISIQYIMEKICGFRCKRDKCHNELFNAGDRVKHISYGKGTLFDVPGVGYVVKFDNGKTRRITDGVLKRI